MEYRGKDIVSELLNRRWVTLDDKNIDKLKDARCPGVYVLAYSDKNMMGKEIKIKDIFYVGMSNSKGGVKQRLKQFLTGIEKNTNHSAGMRFLKEHANGVPWSKFKKRNTFYVASFSIPCEVSKDKRTADDLRTMGIVAKLEYDVLAFIKEKTGEEPKLNKK